MDIAKYFKIHTNNGRQYWSFNGNYEQLSSSERKELLAYFQRFDKSKNPNASDQLYRTIMRRERKQADYPLSENQTLNGLLKGLSSYQQLQTADGHFGGDYGGPMFLLPGLIVASHVTQTPFEQWQQELMQIYIQNHQNTDGGWGLHIEGTSTMFGSVMNYVALRLLGVPKDEPQIVKGGNWIRKHGGAINLPSWGKFYLSVLGVYEWDGCTSLFPEIWLLPKSLPIHPSKFWCHTRMVYLPMAYCYGARMVGEESEVIRELRNELYTCKYEEIPWRKVRRNIAQTDSYYPTKPIGKFFNWVADTYEKMAFPSLRKKAMQFSIDYIDAEDEQTNYIDIGPVNQVINSLAVFHAYGRDSEQFQQHVARWKDYLWIAEDGMKMQGYNGSQLWDTAFYVHALTENQSEQNFPEAANKAYDFIDYTQIKEEVNNREQWFRHPSKGGWPFSTAAHGWPISDCTALGLSAALRLNASEYLNRTEIDETRVREAIDLILGYQNKDGSWSTYELQRASTKLEHLNPSEVFGEIMVDYPHIECSSSCVQVLLDFQALNKDYNHAAINKSIDKGLQYILSQQEATGGWYGNWGVCYTYGTWFALEALNKVKDKTNSMKQAIEKGCHFLVNNQHKQGAWGESFESCVRHQFVPHNDQQVVQTAWAVLALSGSGWHNHEAVQKGVDYLLAVQTEEGDFPQQAISGVFNHNCMITYTAYRNVFPLWALARVVKCAE